MYHINKVGWVEVRDKKVLFDRKFSRTQFYVPGGVVYENEKPEDAIVREVNEELGVVLDPATVRPLFVIEAQADGHPEGVLVKVQLFSGAYSGELKPNNEIVEIKMLSSADEELVTPVGILLLRHLKESGQIA